MGLGFRVKRVFTSYRGSTVSKASGLSGFGLRVQDVLALRGLESQGFGFRA